MYKIENYYIKNLNLKTESKKYEEKNSCIRHY